MTVASDTASNADNPYLVNNPIVGRNPFTLNATGVIWTTDATRGPVLTLDGTTGGAATAGPVVDSTKSFTVSTWVDLPSLPTRNATIASQDGSFG